MTEGAPGNEQIIWSGTQKEGFELINAINTYCTCEQGHMAKPSSICPPHQLMHDQRALNGLLFVKRMAEQLKAEEQMNNKPESTSQKSS